MISINMMNFQWYWSWHPFCIFTTFTHMWSKEQKWIPKIFDMIPFSKSCQIDIAFVLPLSSKMRYINVIFLDISFKSSMGSATARIISNLPGNRILAFTFSKDLFDFFFCEFINLFHKYLPHIDFWCPRRYSKPHAIFHAKLFGSFMST